MHSYNICILHIHMYTRFITQNLNGYKKTKQKKSWIWRVDKYFWFQRLTSSFCFKYFTTIYTHLQHTGLFIKRYRLFWCKICNFGGAKSMYVEYGCFMYRGIHEKGTLSYSWFHIKGSTLVQWRRSIYPGGHR